MRLWRKPESYVERRGRFLGWMLSVTRNRAIDEVRSRRRRPLNESQVGDPDDRGSLSDETASEAATREMAGAELVDQREMVRAALKDLPDEQRLAIELAYYGGFTQAEIAERLSTPLGTVKTRIRLGDAEDACRAGRTGWRFGSHTSPQRWRDATPHYGRRAAGRPHGGGLRISRS